MWLEFRNFEQADGVHFGKRTVGHYVSTSLNGRSTESGLSISPESSQDIPVHMFSSDMVSMASAQSQVLYSLKATHEIQSL